MVYFFQERSALSGIPLLKDLAAKFGPDFILPGGGITDSNLETILKQTGVKEFHASARTQKQSEMSFKNEKCSMGSDSSEYSIQVTSVEKVTKLIAIFNDCVA